VEMTPGPKMDNDAAEVVSEMNLMSQMAIRRYSLLGPELNDAIVRPRTYAFFSHLAHQLRARGKARDVRYWKRHNEARDVMLGLPAYRPTAKEFRLSEFLRNRRVWLKAHRKAQMLSPQSRNRVSNFEQATLGRVLRFAMLLCYRF